MSATKLQLNPTYGLRDEIIKENQNGCHIRYLNRVIMSNLRFEVAHKPLPLPRFGLIKHLVWEEMLFKNFMMTAMSPILGTKA